MRERVEFYLCNRENERPGAEEQHEEEEGEDFVKKTEWKLHSKHF